MTDSSEEKEKLEYVKKDLFQPISRPWQFRSQHGDDKSTGDDSNHLFMSEPSMSEADSSEHHLRMLSPMESLTDDQSAGDDGLPPPPPPPARLLTTQAPASPGNTSLSSWESPHLNRRIHLHFSPDPREDRPDLKDDTRYNLGNYRGFVHPAQHALPQQPRTPDRDLASDNQQSSTSEISSGQRRRADKFLHDLRMKSEGQFRESAGGTNDSFDSSYRPPNPHEAMQNIVRQSTKKAAHEHSTDTEVARNTTNNASFSFSAISQEKGDDTIVMTLSDSENEREATTTPSESSRPLDWEAQHSADDEKTAEFKPPRIRMRGKMPPHRRQRSNGDIKQPGHRRQRSGDAAAATLSTGSADWKGMGQDKIPLPPVPGEEDEEEEEDHGENDSSTLEADKVGKNSYQNSFAKTTVDGGVDFNFPSNSASDIAQFSKFALGDDAPAPTAARRSSRRARRDYRHRKNFYLEVESEESSSATSFDFSPRAAFQNMDPRHSRRLSYPVPPNAGYSSPTMWSQGVSPAFSVGSQQSGHQTAHFHFGSVHLPDYSGPIVPPARHNSMGAGERAFHSFDNGVIHHTHHPAWYQATKTERPRASSYDGSGSASSTLSWLSGKLRRGPYGQQPEPDTETLPLVREKPSIQVETVFSDDRETSYGFPSDSESDVSSDEAKDHFKAHMNHEYENDRSLRVIRPSLNNPFQNIGNKGGRFDRRQFSVETSAMPSDEKQFPTYVCPKCNTRQREFFTVSSAPKTFESASGYVAFYFSIYVVAALYLFGLQEGWSKLDCIYFAVITLTTAGLGDFVPTTDGAKIICSVFIYFGVACIGLLLGSYIAGMLDESSFRTARENRIKSCPNCSRIRNIKEAAERRHTVNSRRVPSRSPPNSGYYTPRSNEAAEPTYESDPKKMKRQRQDSPRMSLPSPVAQMNQTPDSRNLAMGPGQGTMHVDMSPDSFSDRKEDFLSNSMRSPMMPGCSPSTGVSPMLTPKLTPSISPSIMGSPMTTQILRRQSHSRHASIDLGGGSNHFAATFQKQPVQRTQRRRSADLPATIHEAGNHEPAPPPPPGGRWMNVDADDDSTSETESSSSESEAGDGQDDEAKKYGMKNAKYVFVTLREALLNSVVIITFGCMGFCFIEGFSIIDSWYFTTVLLTTVGYGDITPYTKGGKLFATIYILVAGTILLNNMSMISMIPLELRKRRTERAVLEQFGDWLDDAALRELATGPLIQRLNLSYEHPTGLDECTREMFALAMLVRLGKVTEEDIKQTFAAFRKLDVHNEGVLNSRSIIAGMIQKHRNSSVNLQRLAEVKSEQQQPMGTGSYHSQGFSSFAPPSNKPSWVFGYGNWSDSMSTLGSVYPHGAQQGVPVPALSERPLLGSAQSNYGSGRPMQTNRPRKNSC